MERFYSYRFCSNRSCPRCGECLRNISNAEFNIIIKRCDFECNEKNGYKDLLLHHLEQDEIDANFKTIVTDAVTKKPRKKRSDAGKSRTI